MDCSCVRFVGASDDSEGGEGGPSSRALSPGPRGGLELLRAPVLCDGAEPPSPLTVVSGGCFSCHSRLTGGSPNCRRIAQWEQPVFLDTQPERQSEDASAEGACSVARNFLLCSCAVSGIWKKTQNMFFGGARDSLESEAAPGSPWSDFPAPMGPAKL